MTAKELSDNEDYANQLNTQMAGGSWIKFGTVHHHCSAGAFQSGTDSADETEMGIHITLGNIGGPRHSIHGRVSLTIPGTLNADGTTAAKATHAYYSATFSDWFEIPDVGIPVSDSIREEIAKHILCTPEAEDAKFPAQWAENLIKEVPKPVVSRVGFAAHEHEAWHKSEDNYGFGTTPAQQYNGYHPAQQYHPAAVAEPVRRTSFSDSELERVEEFCEFVEQLMDYEQISLATLFGIMQINESHYLSEKEWEICERIERELTRLDVSWNEYIDAHFNY
jgi:hypothetical protein